MNNIDLLKTKDVSDILKCSMTKALQFIKYSGIEYIRIGRNYYVKAESLESFINVSINKTIDTKG